MITTLVQSMRYEFTPADSDILAKVLWISVW